MNGIPANAAVQALAKQVLAELADDISSASTEATIAAVASARLRAHGLNDTWYHNCPALVLLGSRSCLSVSGRDYVAATEPVGDFNLVTVDLSPMQGKAWGDCARSFAVEGGVVVDSPSSPELAAGMNMQDMLHRAMRQFVQPETSLHELYEFANGLIEAEGFENLDFRRNLGHSIETHPAARQFIERGNRCKLGRLSCFTFEPHIRTVRGRWGFKHENIYYFDEDGAVEQL